jgi:hypothetical protein
LDCVNFDPKGEAPVGVTLDTPLTVETGDGGGGVSEGESATGFVKRGVEGWVKAVDPSDSFDATLASLVGKEAPKGLFEGGTLGCATGCEVEGKLNEGFGCSWLVGIEKIEEAEAVEVGCLTVEVVVVPNGEEALEGPEDGKMVGFVSEGDEEEPSLVVPNFVGNKELADDLFECSTLVTVPGVVVGDAGVKGLASGLSVSLFSDCPVGNGGAAKVGASERVWLTDGFPKLKPVDVEGWPKLEVIGLDCRKGGGAWPSEAGLVGAKLKGLVEGAFSVGLGASWGTKSESESSSAELTSTLSSICSSIWLS